VQRRQSAARDQHERESADAHRCVDARAAFFVVALSVHDETRDAEHDGEQERRFAEQEEQHIRQPRAERPDPVRDRVLAVTRGRERGIVPVIREQRDQHHQRDDTKGDDGAFTQAARNGRGEAFRRLGAIVGGFCHLCAMCLNGRGY
jgi:hypothetical protein